MSDQSRRLFSPSSRLIRHPISVLATPPALPSGPMRVLMLAASVVLVGCGSSAGNGSGGGGSAGGSGSGGSGGGGSATGGGSGGGSSTGGGSASGGGSGGGGATGGGSAAGGGSATGGGSGTGGGTTADGGWWTPAYETTWQWQLQGTIDTTVDAGVYDIDLFDTPQATIDSLHAMGRKVVCYFDTAYEPGRPDSMQLLPYIGNPVQGWPGQYWLDTRNATVRSVMAARIALAQTKHCDGLEPDDVDEITNSPGISGLTANDQLDFCRFIANTGHAAGLGVALKNDLDQVPDLVGDFDFAINEQCFMYMECDTLMPFTAANKAVLQTEYTSQNMLSTLGATICPQSLPLGFSTIIKTLDLTAPVFSCR